MTPAAEREKDGREIARSAARPRAGGELLRVNRNGTMTLVVGELDLPTSLEFVRNTAYIVTLNGEIWRVDNVGSNGHHDRGCRDGGRHSDDI